MGMFDYLHISTNMLPVSDEEKKIIGQTPGWQTKDFECILTDIYITDEGDLKIKCFDEIFFPKEKRPYPSSDGLLGLYGMIKRVNERLENIPHHGFVNFYSDIGKDWYEFNAKFTDGKLQYIDGGKETRRIP